jgi:hypothetical protein
MTKPYFFLSAVTGFITRSFLFQQTEKYFRRVLLLDQLCICTAGAANTVSEKYAECCKENEEIL